MNPPKLLFFLLIVSVATFFLSAAEPPKLRGVMVAPNNFHESDLKFLAEEWNANLVRWQLNWGFPHGKADTATIDEYNRWIENECEQLDKMIPYFRLYGVKICLDLHTSPGGFVEENSNRIFEEKDYTEAFINTWINLAERYKDEQSIWAYDILNEPVERDHDEGTYYVTWHDLAEETAIRIREIDPDTPIIFEPSDWDNPSGFENLQPLSLTNIIYSAHMYIPIAFTHQGVTSVVKEDNPVTYPGVINGVFWDKAKLREALEPVQAFQRKYDVPIYVGEFSAIRWAPENSAYNYLRDIIDIFEEYGWDWSYHAFREWNGWSVEYTEDKNNNAPASEPTNREILLRSFFEKNVRFKE